MKVLPVVALAVLTVLSAVRVVAQTEASGESAGARAALARAAQNNPNDVSALTGYAEFLERYGDPACREAYARLLEALRNSPDTARAGVIARRLAAIDLLAGDSAAAARDLEAYRAATGKSLAAPAAPSGSTTPAHGPDSRAHAPVCPHGGHFSGNRRGRDPSRTGAQRGDQRLPGFA